MAQNRLQAERIDTAPLRVRPMSYNVPGHEDRIKAHCKRIQAEYFDLRGKDGRFVLIAKLARSIKLMDST